ELLVVRPARIDIDRGAGRTAPKEYHAAAAAHGIQGLPPHLRAPGGVDGDLRATTTGGGAERGHHVGRGRRVHALAEAQGAHALEAPAGLADEDHARLA